MALIPSLNRNLIKSEREIAKGWHGSSLGFLDYFFSRCSPSSVLASDAEKGLLDCFVSLAFLLLVSVSLASLPLHASGALLLERDLASLVLLNTPSGSDTPTITREASLLCLPRSSTWPCLAVTMSSLVGDPQREGSRGLYSSRSSRLSNSQLASCLIKNFVCALGTGWLIPFAWGLWCGQNLFALLRATLCPLCSTLCALLLIRTLHLRQPTLLPLSP